MMRPVQRRIPAIWCAATMAWAICLAGCRADQAATDRQLERHASAARQAFAEGEDPTAIREYRLAVKRAWAHDAPAEIRRHAYNLAACLAAAGHPAAARDWLCEANVECRRAGQNPAEIWLLEGRIAREQGRWDEATAITDAVRGVLHVRPARSAVTRQHDVPYCLTLVNNEKHGRSASEHGLRSTAVHLATHLVPCTKDNPLDPLDTLRERRVTEVQAHLLAANLACDRGDLEAVQRELAAAERQLRRERQPAIQAEVSRVAGRVDLLAGRIAHAGSHFDHEAELLRAAGHFREMPAAWFDAGDCYVARGLPDAAADRYLRAARMLYARDRFNEALLLVDRALPLVEQANDAELRGRIAVLFHEIAWGVREASGPAPLRRSRPSVPTPLPPTTTPPIPPPGGETLPSPPPAMPEPMPPSGAAHLPPLSHPAIAPARPAVAPAATLRLQLPGGGPAAEANHGATSSAAAMNSAPQISRPGPQLGPAARRTHPWPSSSAPAAPHARPAPQSTLLQ